MNNRLEVLEKVLRNMRMNGVTHKELYRDLLLEYHRLLEALPVEEPKQTINKPGV
jgi:hypothetical protein